MITNQQIRDRMGPELYSASSLGDIESMRHRMEREEAAIPRNLKLRLEHAKCRYRDDKMPIYPWPIKDPRYTLPDTAYSVPPLGVAKPEDCSVAPIGVARGEPENAPFNAPQPSPLQRMYDALTKGGVFEMTFEEYARPDYEQGLSGFTVKAKVTEENWQVAFHAMTRAFDDNGRGDINPPKCSSNIGKTITITARLQPDGSVDVKASVE